MNVAIYARVSRDDKEQNPERQYLACVSYCESKGHNVVVYEYDYVTGDSNPFERIGFNKLLLRKPQAIIFEEMSRFTREHPMKVFRRIQFLKDKNIKIVSVSEPAFNMDSEFGDVMLYLISWFNNYFLRNLRKNVKQGQERARKEGKVIGRPKAKFNEFRAYHLLFVEKRSLQFVADELNTSKATINRFKSVAAKNPSLFIKESDFPKTDVFETGDV